MNQSLLINFSDPIVCFPLLLYSINIGFILPILNNQFPAEHIYQPGDWNQGMLIFSLDSNSSFNLHINWAYQNNLYTGVLHEVICANQ
ncbi:MAG: hypothetical protein ACI8P9_002933 [Parasphingorhabdus sp.]|jgi:hypothetical protein